MQKINLLLEQTSKELKKGSSASPIAAGQTRQDSESTASSRDAGAAGPDHVDAINQVFAEFEFAYHNQFHRAFPNGESLAIAKKYWLSCLQQYAPDCIVHASKQLIKTHEYLPSMAVMVQACERDLTFGGMPSARQAYIEACAAPPPKANYDWSHPAVYHAGRASDWYFLASEPEARAFPVFEYHYLQICRQVSEGKDLNIQSPPPLTDKIDKNLQREEIQSRIAKMRKELDL